MARKRMGTHHKAMVAAGVSLVAAALVTELRKPSGERTWHGTVGGVVPYDFRLPTPKRLRASVWDPDGPLFTRHAWGVGWTLNVGRLVHVVTEESRARRG